MCRTVLTCAENCVVVTDSYRMLAAGFAKLYSSYAAFGIVEGTKEVLQQQTGRYLLKCFSSLKKLEIQKQHLNPSTQS